ncbi:MAG: sodium:calcium antiporter [Candidatus Aenigmatarchaeota archaeon]|nr:MAG: sodium:calcium antiporter [Candidatus Aenigmarchaeota archaeon]
MVYQSIALLLGGLVIMFFSSKWAIRYAIGISESLALGRFAVGFIFIAMTTTFPELVVSISSTLHGEPGLAVGNALGSVLANLTLILGVAVLVGGTMRLRKDHIGDQIEVLFVSALVSIFLLQAGSLSILQGLILLVLFAFFVNKVRRGGIPMKAKPDILVFFGHFARFIASVAVLLISSEMIVRGSIQMVEAYAFAPEFIGLTIIAVGTSMPELAVGIRAIHSKEYALALGDLVGASVIDLTLIMGIVALLNPVPVNLAHVSGVMPFILAAILANWYFLSKRINITRKIAFLLVCLFLLFLLEQIGILTLFG